MKRPRLTSSPHLRILLATLALALIPGCAEDTGGGESFFTGGDLADETTPPFEPVPGQDTDGDGRLDELEVRHGTDPTRGDAPCASATYTVLPGAETPRVDLVILVDTSGSMREELPQLRRGLEEFFGPLTRNGILDFTITIIASWSHFPLCFAADDTDASCASANGPVRNARFLYYDQRIASTDALERALQTYATSDPHGLAREGWREQLRAGAQPIFLVLTDDESSLERSAFEQRLAELDTTGRLFDGDQRRFVWHAVVGIPTPERGVAWGASRALVTQRCASATGTGETYQQLSVLTGGLRFSVCDAISYTAIFERLTTPIIAGARIPCQLRLPEPPLASSGRARVSSLGLQLEQRGELELLERVSTDARCGASSYQLSSSGAGEVFVSLCPQLCQRLERAEQATLLLGAACQPERCGQITHSGCNVPLDDASAAE